MTPDDYIAYQWIRTNTDKKSVCVNDQYLVDSYTRPPYAQGVMTERHMYISNMELIKKCMNNDPEAIGELRKNGVSYVIQTKRLFPDFYCPGGEKVYDGNTIAVYDIR